MRTALLSILLLAACAATPSPPAAVPSLPLPSKAQTAASLYTELSVRATDRGDRQAAAHFSSKARQAEADGTVSPDTPSDRLPHRIPAGQRQRLQDNHTQLLAALETSAAPLPEIAAQGVAYFDCWLADTAFPGPHRGGIDCEDAFLRALATLESAPGIDEGTDPAPAAPVRLSDAPPSTIPDTAVTETSPALPDTKPDAALSGDDVVVTYLVFFDWNSDALTPDAVDVLEMVLTDLHNIDHYDVVLNGHADTSGQAGANVDLSLRRADHVAAWLRAAGIPERLISTYAFGDSDPKEHTGPNVRDPANRRVEVVIE